VAVEAKLAQILLPRFSFLSYKPAGKRQSDARTQEEHSKTHNRGNDGQRTAMVDFWSKLLFEKGVITDAEFKNKLGKERTTYQQIRKSIRH